MYVDAEINEESDEDTGDTDDGMDVDGYQEEDKEEMEVEIHVEPQDFTQTPYRPRRDRLDKRRHQRGKYFRFLESVIDYKMETIKKYLYNDN
ncbi:hypothetical protein RvY_15270 [Ramazzottius varieornatus]|uniref:Uncharacterized protein n=1 Tax=Ramazzottius varieornatus TaxID=947166 RepID=A0A1D1VUC5_RAMVA|nr:hypothetical protein RvY_15270 [Ramazzottius varieornatus]